MPGLRREIRATARNLPQAFFLTACFAGDISDVAPYSLRTRFLDVLLYARNYVPPRAAIRGRFLFLLGSALAMIALLTIALQAMAQFLRGS